MRRRSLDMLERRLLRRLSRLLEKRRGRAVADRDRRIGEAYAAWPDLQELDQEIREAGVRLVVAAMDNETDRAARQRLQWLNERRAGFLAAHGLENDFDRTRPYCPLCADSGVLGDEPCPCARRAVAEMMSGELALAVEQDAGFAKFDENLFTDPTGGEPGEASPRQRIRLLRRMGEAYARDFAVQGPRNLLFSGKPGTGKTYLMQCIAKAVAEQGYTVMGLSAAAMFERLRQYRALSASFDPDPERLDISEAYYDRLLNGELLLIDDLGSEASGALPYAELLGLLDARRSGGRSTIISTNAEPADLKRFYDERLVSRLLGHYELHRFIGEDVRLSRRRLAGQTRDSRRAK